MEPKCISIRWTLYEIFIILEVHGQTVHGEKNSSSTIKKSAMEYIPPSMLDNFEHHAYRTYRCIQHEIATCRHRRIDNYTKISPLAAYGEYASLVGCKHMSSVCGTMHYLPKTHNWFMLIANTFRALDCSMTDGMKYLPDDDDDVNVISCRHHYRQKRECLRKAVEYTSQTSGDGTNCIFGIKIAYLKFHYDMQHHILAVRVSWDIWCVTTSWWWKNPPACLCGIRFKKESICFAI